LVIRLVWKTESMTEFEDADLTGSQFREVDLSGARFEGANLTGVTMEEVWLVNVAIDGLSANLRINGVDVTPYVTAELQRTDPERALVQPTDVESLRASWTEVRKRWDATLTRAEELPEATLHESVNGEFSFVQTLRHLVFAIDKWFVVPILGGAFCPFGLPNTGSLDFPFPGLDHDANPSFAAVLAARRDREEQFSEYLATLDPAVLTETRSVLENGNAPVLACLHAVLGEEVAHLGYATRDLDILTA
jgi:hypothetical protein